MLQLETYVNSQHSRGYDASNWANRMSVWVINDTILCMEFLNFRIWNFVCKEAVAHLLF